MRLNWEKRSFRLRESSSSISPARIDRICSSIASRLRSSSAIRSFAFAQTGALDYF